MASSSPPPTAVRSCSPRGARRRRSTARHVGRAPWRISRQQLDDPVELLQPAGDGLRRGFPPLRAARADHGLRLPRSPLVGRERELAELTRLVTAHPLVTVTGPGGVGKSRLALETAVAAAGAFPDGLHLVELSLVAGPADVEPLDAAAAVIGGSRRLVVFDSCEHCLDAGAGGTPDHTRMCRCQVVKHRDLAPTHAVPPSQSVGP